MSTLQSSIELAKVLLPTFVGGGIGLLLLGRMKEIESKVAGRSDFNRRWADLFFDASSTFMVSVERRQALVIVLAQAVDPNNQAGTEMQGRVNDLLPVMVENRLRLRRLAALATTQGPEAYAAADRVYSEVAKSTQTRTYDLLVLGDQIDEFNRAARKAHAEMLALGNPR